MGEGARKPGTESPVALGAPRLLRLPLPSYQVALGLGALEFLLTISADGGGVYWALPTCQALF